MRAIKGPNCVENSSFTSLSRTGFWSSTVERVTSTAVAIASTVSFVNADEDTIEVVDMNDSGACRG
jgi:hypothetical protein